MAGMAEALWDALFPLLTEEVLSPFRDTGKDDFPIFFNYDSNRGLDVTELAAALVAAGWTPPTNLLTTTAEPT